MEMFKRIKTQSPTTNSKASNTLPVAVTISQHNKTSNATTSPNVSPPIDLTTVSSLSTREPTMNVSTKPLEMQTSGCADEQTEDVLSLEQSLRKDDNAVVKRAKMAISVDSAAMSSDENIKVHQQMQPTPQISETSQSSSDLTQNIDSIDPVEPEINSRDPSINQIQGPPDVTIKVQSEKYEVHRSLLMEKCDFFRAMFTSGMRETWERDVDLKEVSVAAFNVILKYLYTNSIPLTKGNFTEILSTAMYLQMKFMVDADTLYPMLNKDNFMFFLEFAQANKSESIIDCVRLYLGDNYLELGESGHLMDVTDNILDGVLDRRSEGSQVVTAIVDNIRTRSSSFYYMDSDGGPWKFLTSVPMSLRGGGVAVLNNYIYVTGSGARRAQDHAYRYNPIIHEWKEIPPPIQERDLISLVALDDCVYAVGVGGMCNTNPNHLFSMEYQKFNSVERYDPILNTWTPRTSIPRRLCWLTATAHAGLIFVHGKVYDVQFDISSSAGSNFYYNPQTDEWCEWKMGSFQYSLTYTPFQYKLSMSSDVDNFYFIGSKDKIIDEIREYDFRSGQQIVKYSSATAGPKREEGVFLTCEKRIYVVYNRKETEYYDNEQQKWVFLPGSQLCKKGDRAYTQNGFICHLPKRTQDMAAKRIKPM
ncbi:kelch-like protein 36 [Glandiceps talaboti]